jgi:hypothetical protein
VPLDNKVPLDIDGICRVLNKHAVSFIVIGGVAGILLGSGLNTFDFDLVPEMEAANLHRLSNALIEMNAEVMFAGKVRNTGDGDWLKASNTWNLATDFGRLDVMLAASGAGGYSELEGNAERHELVASGLIIQVAGLDDLIAMKEAAGRNKDLLALPVLRWLRDRGPDDEEPTGLA